MKLKSIALSLTILFIASAFVHKFYVSIYHLDYQAQKKRLEITARIFNDDLNLAIEKKYHHKTNLGLANQSASDVDFLKKYLSEHFLIWVNNKPQNMVFVSCEMESNVLVCYLKCIDIQNIKALKIKNTALFEMDDSQQNILQLNMNGKKQNALLVVDNDVFSIN
jgi:hypothetical protein